MRDKIDKYTMSMKIQEKYAVGPYEIARGYFKSCWKNVCI